MRTVVRVLAGIVIFLLLPIGAAIGWWKINYPTYVYRYRMTVEVQVGGKIHSGSSVIEVRINRQPQIGDAPPYVARIRGEAVFVDLGEGRSVIALLAAGPRAEKVDYSINIVPTLFNVPFENWAELGNMRDTRRVPESLMPTFVTFANLNDPKSARVVSPADFPAVFGSNIRLKSVTITMTSNAVTRTIEKKMPVIIEKLREDAKKLHARRVGSPYSAALGHFSTF